MDAMQEWGPGEIIGGHRLLRQLGSGRSAQVWLAAPAASEDGERVALKLIRGGAAPDRAAAEAEALWRARGPHVVRLRDVVPHGAGTPFLILDAVPHDLAGVLAHGLSPGAVVTVLVPIAQELARLHEVGVTHGALRLAAVGLDQRGRPVLLGFGSASCGAVDDARRLADRRAFAALALVVLAAVPAAERGAEWDRLSAWFAASEPAAEEWLDACIERCYRLADPAPVRLLARESLRDVAHAVAATAGEASAPSIESPARRALDAVRRGVAHAMPALRALGAGTAKDAVAGSGRPRVRARFWVPAVAVALGLLAVVVLPGAEPVVAADTRADQATPAPSRPPLTAPMPTTWAESFLGGGHLVELDTADGPRRLVLFESPEGWEVRDYVLRTE